MMAAAISSEWQVGYIVYEQSYLVWVSLNQSKQQCSPNYICAMAFDGLLVCYASGTSVTAYGANR